MAGGRPNIPPGALCSVMGPAECQNLIRTEIERWGKVIALKPGEKAEF
jgi:hypothetical protein